MQNKYMKLFTAFIALALFASVSVMAKENSASVKTQQNSITWVYNLSEGLTLARAAKKPLMVDFYAEWCGWCKKLDKNVYTNSEVAALSKEFVCVKVDTDKFGKDASKYAVQGLPTIEFLNADGTVIDSLVGYAAAPDFASKMKKVLKK